MASLPPAPSIHPETSDETIARLTAELREARDQQAATTEFLELINRSPGDLAPVFDTILEKAHSLCGATKGSFVIVDGENFRAVVARGLSEPYATILREAQHNPPGSAPHRLLNGESLVHRSDASAQSQTDSTGQRLSLARIAWADCVQTKGLGLALCSTR